jgi:hypothetical protein
MTRWTGDSKESSGMGIVLGLMSSQRRERERIRWSILKFTQDTG